MENKSIAAIIVGLILVVSLIAIGSTQFGIFTEGEVMLAIPHMASYKCEPVSDKFNVLVTIPKGGIWLSKSSVGFHTNGISNIQVEVPYDWWDILVKDVRVRYKVCDQNGNNCVAEQTLVYNVPDTKLLTPNSLSFETQAMRMYFEKRTLSSLLRWVPDEGANVRYDGRAFGLTLSSTTRDPAGDVICSTSCDLTCPDIGHREKLIQTDETSLKFYDTAPYLEYWESIDYDLNKQGGATVYDSSSRTFCLAGAIYDAGVVRMDNGVVYIYPDTHTGRLKACCPGAAIAASHSDLLCTEDFTWEVFPDDATCMSDLNCPGAGNPICQDRQLSSGYNCVDKDSNNVGVCEKTNTANVDCCDSSDCNADMVCDTRDYTCKGGTPNPTCGDNLVQAGEECDDGNTVSGDGCSSQCEIEIVPPPPPPPGSCELECDAMSDLNPNKQLCKMNCWVQSSLKTLFDTTLKILMWIGIFIAVIVAIMLLIKAIKVMRK